MVFLTDIWPDRGTVFLAYAIIMTDTVAMKLWWFTG